MKVIGEELYEPKSKAVELFGSVYKLVVVTVMLHFLDYLVNESSRL